MIRFDKRAISERTDCAHRSEITVRFHDIDAAGIVFFARFFDYVHVAYEEFLSEAGAPLAEVLRNGTWAAPLRHAEADYLVPVRFGAVLSVELVVAAVEPTEITLGWRISEPFSPEKVRFTSEKQQTVSKKPSAVVQTVHTFIDPQTMNRISVPDEISRKLEPVLLQSVLGE